jgi:hypothetical protein
VVRNGVSFKVGKNVSVWERSWSILHICIPTFIRSNKDGEGRGVVVGC